MANEQRKQDQMVEVRTTAPTQFRAEEDGVFEGYIVAWDTVDSYNSTFARGAFTKTISERGDRVKVFFDHRTLIGHALEINEDDYGVHVRGQIVTGVKEADDALAFMRAGTIEGLSFGFIPVKEGHKNGVREIREVKLLEFGPVVFPANDNALITDVRAEAILESAGLRTGGEEGYNHQEDPKQGDGTMTDTEEGRSTDFMTTYQGRELDGRHFRLVDSLEWTLFDVWMAWQAGSQEDLMAALDAAIADFQSSYLEYAEEVLAYIQEGGSRSAPVANDLAARFQGWLMEQEGRTLDDVARATSLTLGELRALQRGDTIEAESKVAKLSADLATAHAAQRGEVAEALFRQVRAGLPAAQKRRLQSLLGRADTSLDSDSQGSESRNSLVEGIRAFNQSINQENH